MDALRLILLVVGVVVIAAIYVAGRRGRPSVPRFAYIRDLLRARRRGVDIPELDMSAAVRPEDEAHERPIPPVSDTPDSRVAEAPPGTEEPVVGHAEPDSANEPSLGDLDALSGLVAERGPAPPEAEVGPIAAADDVRIDTPVDPDELLVLVFYILAPRGQVFAGPALRDAVEAAGFEYGDMQIFHYLVGTDAGRRPLLSLANALEPGTFDLEAMEEFETPGITVFLQLPGPLEGREAFERLLEVARGLAEGLGGELCDDRRSVLTPQTISHLRERVEAFRFKLQMARAGKHRK